MLNEPQQPSNVFFSLLAIHYIFDIHYSVGYGLMNVVDEYCIRRPQLLSNQAPTKKKRADLPVCVSKFIDSFDLMRCHAST